MFSQVIIFGMEKLINFFVVIQIRPFSEDVLHDVFISGLTLDAHGNHQQLITYQAVHLVKQLQCAHVSSAIAFGQLNRRLYSIIVH